MADTEHLKISPPPPSPPGGGSDSLETRVALLEAELKHLATSKELARLETKIDMLFWVIPIVMTLLTALATLAVKFL